LIVRQVTQATFHALISERPAVVLVRSGEKSIRRGMSRLALGPGRLAVIPAGEPLTIENKPEAGLYMASAVVLGTEMLPLGDPTRVASDDRALTAFERAAAACEDPLLPSTVRDHLVKEVLLWLAQEGVGASPTRVQGLVPRLRELLSQDLAADWTGPMAAQRLGVSEATLRRRLAEEGSGFADVLADLRMTRALSMLQTTVLPVNRIALDVGYDSPSRFAGRFRARFGIAPSAVRGWVDRIGTTFDRARAVSTNRVR
jgi:AraC-like DNA-binding protein